MKKNSCGSYHYDMHSHILPDHDCAGNITDAMAVLREAHDAGIRTVCATPHFYPHVDNPESFRKKRSSALARLEDAVRNDPVIGEMRLVAGAEVLLCQGLENLASLDMLGYAGGGTLLIEMPDTPWSAGLLESLRALRTSRGMHVIIAHPERYTADGFEKLASAGFRFQFNSSLVHTLCGRALLRRFISLNPSRLLMGSDAHVGRTKNPYKDFRLAEKLLGPDVCDSMTRECEKATAGDK